MKKSKETDTIDFFAESKFDDVSPKPSNKETDTIDFFAESKLDGPTKRKPEKDDFVDYFADPKNSTLKPNSSSSNSDSEGQLFSPSGEALFSSVVPGTGWWEDKRWNSEISIHNIEVLQIPKVVRWVQGSDYDSSHTLCFRKTESPALDIIKSILLFLFVYIWFVIFFLFITIKYYNIFSSNGEFPILTAIIVILLIAMIFIFFIIKACLSKNWITITRDTLEIERGVFRRHKSIKFERSPQKTIVEIEKSTTYNNIPNSKPVYIADKTHNIKLYPTTNNEMKDYELYYLLNNLLKLKITD